MLEINGVGYRAEVQAATMINFTLGYSHPIVYQLPPGVTAKVDRQVTITLESADRQLIGSVAAQVRELRPPEPYKGKGIKYATEKIRRKAGKAAAGASAGLAPGAEQDGFGTFSKTDGAPGTRAAQGRGTDERPRLSVYRSLQSHLRASGFG